MRDPQARAVLQPGAVFRHLREDLPADHPLHSSHAQRWIEQGWLIPFEWDGPRRLTSPRVPFVSAPDEWCDLQFADAANLTLSLLESANEASCDLKDASAWNVVFDGCKPVFCDLTSIEPLTTHHWWAAGQFARHFILPLWLSAETDTPAGNIFRMCREGASPEFARGLLGWRRFLSRCWPLLVEQSNNAAAPETASAASPKTLTHRKHLVTSLRWMLESVTPQDTMRTQWSRYTTEREHYSDAALARKKQLVDQWISHLHPACSLDLGCNTGEFTRIAVAHGSKVIAIDSDHGSVQTLYRDHPNSTLVHPVRAPLDDVRGGSGWAGREHAGLPERLCGQADLVMMLALIHHLTVGYAIPLEEIAKFAAGCTRRWLIIELIDPADPKLITLCAQRRRHPGEFTLARQRTALDEAGFVVRQEEALSPGHRILALLEKQP